TFDGVDDYATIVGSNAAADWTGSFTATCKMLVSGGQRFNVFGKGMSNVDDAFGMYIEGYNNSGSIYIFHKKSDLSGYFYASYPSVFSQYFYQPVELTVVRDTLSMTYELFINGLSQGVKSYSVGPYNAGNDWGVGKTQDHAPNGKLFDFKLFSRALSIQEVSDLINGNLTDTSNLVVWLPMAEGAGTTLYDVSGNNLHATLYNTSEASFWSGTQDVFHYNIDKGFSLYTHTTNNDLRVPYDLNGQPLSITPPSGYTLASEHPAGNWHNNAETKIQMMAGDANLAAGTFWMDSAGTLQARSYNDIVGIWNNENITFADVSVANKKKRIATYDSAQV
ncbi:MAG: hypothetical protein D6711_00495, partial [Chloroflexi bacterium]